MSARTLRLVISVALVAAVFIYLFSNSLNSMLPTKAVDEGMLGGPVPGLTRWQLSLFEEGRAIFKKNYRAQEGLGPLYNGSSCIECHGGKGTAGGAGESPELASYSLMARRKSDGRFAKEQAKSVVAKVERSDLDFLFQKGGPVLLRKSVSDNPSEIDLPKDCKLDACKDFPEEAEFRSRRYAPALYGLGLVETVPERVFYFQAAKQAQEPKCPKGKVVRSPILFGDACGRFGRKAERSSLMNCAAAELGAQLGLSNPLFRHTLTAKNGLDKLPACLESILPADPNLDSKTLSKLNFYLCCLAPPPRVPLSPDAQKGSVVFQNAGCASCHQPQMRSPELAMLINPEQDWSTVALFSLANTQGSSRISKNFGLPDLRIEKEPKFIRVKALENVLFFPYSDFLVHDMGAQLADGIAQDGLTGAESGTAALTSGADWRTAPLWGLRLRKYYMHDGRTTKLNEAIMLHGGQGAASARAFTKLSDEEKKQLLAFLNSL